MPESGEKIFFPWKTFAFEAFLFSLTLILGIITALNWQELFKFQKIQPQPISFWRFLFYFLFGTLLIFSISLLSKKFQNQKRAIFKIFFILSSVFGTLYLFFPFLNIFSLILIIFLVYVWLKKPTVFLNNLLIIFGLAGFGGILGLSFQPLVIVFLLLVFSIYDFIAVYKTKHMVKMAREMLEAKIIFGLIVSQNVSDFKADLKEVEPGGRFLILGGGDVAFPLLLSASLVPSGIFNPLIVAAFSLIGLFLSFYVFASQKVRQPIPALPPIALFSIIGYLVTRF
jgi:presenilin-like A22 family membrane protease